MANRYQEFVARKRREYGDKFSDRSLTQKFVPYYESGRRIKVETLGHTLTGTVGVTTGWVPCFLLLRTSRSRDSIYTLSDLDKIVAVQIGRRYQAI